jgi:hypothetical protein
LMRLDWILVKTRLEVLPHRDWRSSTIQSLSEALKF